MVPEKHTKQFVGTKYSIDGYKTGGGGGPPEKGGGGGGPGKFYLPLILGPDGLNGFAEASLQEYSG